MNGFSSSSATTTTTTVVLASPTGMRPLNPRPHPIAPTHASSAAGHHHQHHQHHHHHQEEDHAGLDDQGPGGGGGGGGALAQAGRDVGGESGRRGGLLMGHIALTTMVTHILASAPVATLYQRACLPARPQPRQHPPRPGPGPSTAGGPASLGMMVAALHRDAAACAEQFRGLHRGESMLHVAGSGLLDLLDVAVSGALLGVFSEVSKFLWFLLTLGEEMDVMGPVVHAQRSAVPSLAKRLQYLAYFGVSNAVCFGATAALCLPLHVANFQVRHHRWQGWAGGVFPLRGNGFWKALPTLTLEYQFMVILNRQLRRHIYDLLGRPFSKTIATQRKEEREKVVVDRLTRNEHRLPDAEEDEKTKKRRMKGKEKVVYPDNEEAAGTKDTSPGERGVDESENLQDVGRELLRKAGFHLLTRGIAVGVTLLTGVVHMPLSTITYSILAAPHAYTGPIDCAQKILAAEGWAGFYKGLFWYVLHSADLLYLHDVWTGAEYSLVD